MTRVLDVYLENKLAGNLEQTTGGDLVFTYQSEYIETATFAISLSLPLQKEPLTGNKVKAFFSGLLPEESVRARLARYLGLSEKNPFALLEAVGGDCAGALALYPRGEIPPKVSDEVEVLDDGSLKDVLDLIRRRPMLAGDDGYRLSLAGAQDKLAVGFKEGRVLLLKGGAPTTHILKPLIDRVQDSAHNEFFCMTLAKRVGLDVPKASLQMVGKMPYYLVERYDRDFSGSGRVVRIHQEDFCQALGISPEIKYEREGGPSIKACQDLISKHSARPAVDQIKLLDMILFNYLIGNADAHGKNYSLLYKGNKPEIAPAYDLLSTAIYPDLSEKMAMKIGGKYKPSDVYLRHFYKLIPDTKAARTVFERQSQKMINKMKQVAPSLIGALQAQGIHTPVFDNILAVIRQRADRLTE